MKQLLFIGFLLVIFQVPVKLSAQWEELKPPVSTNIYLTCFAANDTFLFIGTSGGYVLRSSDKGQSWLIGKPDAVYPYSISSADYLSGTLFINTSNGTYRSTDNGDTWVYVNDIPLNGAIPETVVQVGNNLYADLFDTSFNGAHIALSSDKGKTWIPVNNGLGVNSYIFGVFDTTLFAKGGSLYRLDNATQTWTLADSGLSNLSIAYFAATKTTIFVSAGEDGIFRSTDNGSHWTPSGFNKKLRVASLAVFNDTIFAGASEGGVFLSTDEGISWTENDTGLANSAFVNDELFVYNKYLFLISDGGSIWRRPLSEISGVENLDISKNGIVLHPNYPNPFSAQTTISFSTSEREFVDVKIYDLLGKECAGIYSGELDPGEHFYSWDAACLPFGIYTCIIRAADGTLVAQQIVIK
ncbi:MAG: T9SS type A sorting domain-containing protein [Candidatus Kapaibacterium sp.]